MPFEHGAWTYQARRALLAQVMPGYHAASRARKHLILNAFVKATGYARPTAIRLLNHPPADTPQIRRTRGPYYGPEVQQALSLAWKATHFVCAKRLLPALPTLMEALEQWGHVRLTEEHRRQVLAMSLSTAERLLPMPDMPEVHGMSTTTPGLLRKDQLAVRTFTPWQDDQPGFVEMDLVAHCGTHVDGGFLSTLTVTDLATCWTECIPLLYKSGEAVVAALEQARRLFPFPLLGIDTDSGAEFLNDELIAYCEQHQLTFTRGRPSFKNDQAHVEQKNGAVVRKVVGCVRLEGVQAYHQLREVYRALRLVVNCFQPSLKLQAKVRDGDRVRRVYDLARTPLERLFASGVLAQTRQEDLRGRVQQLDPLALSEHLDALRYALWCGAHLPAALEAERPRLLFRLEVCTSERIGGSGVEAEQTQAQQAQVNSDEILTWQRSTHDPLAGCWEEVLTHVQNHPEWTGPQIVQEIGQHVAVQVASAPLSTLLHRLTQIRRSLRATWEHPWPTELIRGEQSQPLPVGHALDHQACSLPPDHQGATETGMLDPSLSALEGCDPAMDRSPGTPLVPLTLEQAMEGYLQNIRAMDRGHKTLQWHQTSLGALQRYVWEQFHCTEVRHLSGEMLRSWMRDLHTMRSSQTGAALAANTVAAYARSVRAFCNWLVQQGTLIKTPFPQGAVPKGPPGLPQLVEATTFVSLLRACQLPDGNVHQDTGMTARNRAILWLLLDTGLSVSEVCSLRLEDIDGTTGTVTVRNTRGRTRLLPLSEKGQQAVNRYLEQARLTPAWKPAGPEAQEVLLLTELRQPLTKNSLTFLFMRLSQRAGFTTHPISPSMLRDTYAIRFLQAGGDLHDLQEQLGLADRASVRRYQRFCDEQRREEAGAQASSEQAKPPQLARQSKGKRRKVRR